jgi:HPt (histidine-containing phosphotransfer) domain-containing protein
VSDRADSLAAADLASAVRVWTQFRGLIFERLEAVEKAVTAIQQTALTPDVRQKGALEAHRLAGSLGMFGLGAASRVAREIEQLLAENVVGAPDTPPRLAELAGALRHDLEKGPA